MAAYRLTAIRFSGCQYLLGDDDLMNWLFEADLKAVRITIPSTIQDVGRLLRIKHQ